jgi:hypothetical protein
MGGKSKAPPPPDYTPIANAQRESAQMSAELAREQFAWAKQVYAENKGVTDLVVERFLETQARNDQTALEDRQRYEDIFQPLESDLAQEAADYASPERKELERGRATAGVAQQFDAARANATRELESFGINPGATRFAGLDLGLRAQAAASKAAAANQSDQQVDAVGRALRSEAINVGRGYPGQIAAQYGTAMNAGNSGNSNMLNTTASGANTMGTGVQWQGQNNAALAGWGNTLNMGYNNQMAKYKADQESSSGWGSALGAIAGIGMGIAGLPTTSVGGRFFAAEGGAVPEEASPTGGQAIDDVSAQLTAGEFVIPKDAVDWYGQKHFFKLIAKADEERQQSQADTGAVPEVGPATNQPPTFSSRRQALPTG